MHAAATGWPIVGDNIYGNGPRFGEPRLHLHSREIVIPISKNKEPVRVVAPAPEHMQERLQGVRVERGVSATRRPNHRCHHPRRRMIQYSRDVCDQPRGRGVLDRPVKPGDDSGFVAHTVSRAPSCPVIASARTAPGVSPAIATGRKCSVRPCVALSIST